MKAGGKETAKKWGLSLSLGREGGRDPAKLTDGQKTALNKSLLGCVRSRNGSDRPSMSFYAWRKGGGGELSLFSLQRQYTVQHPPSVIHAKIYKGTLAAA